MRPLLSLHGITKTYGSVKANDSIDLAIMPGEIHALLGENGAGKSTLVKTMFGLVSPDSGHMELAGTPYAPANPQAAREAGVAMVFQHFSLFDALSVAENVALAMDHPPKMRDLEARIEHVSKSYGLPLDPKLIVGDLSAGERQRVEIMRCLLQNPKILIMDEPTSVLTPQEAETLFATLRRLRDEGCAILYISHKLEEIRSLCDRATVIRRGKLVEICDPRTTSAQEMAEKMVGQAMTPMRKEMRDFGGEVLKLVGLNAQTPRAFGTALHNIDLSLHAGEIIGIGGVAGNGQEEFMAAISGEILTSSNMVYLRGDPVGNLPPGARRGIGVLAAPEERLGHAAAPGMSLTENALLTGKSRKSLAPSGMIGWPKARAFAQQIIDEFDVRGPGTEAAAVELSGGNLQKFVIGREIMQDPDVLVMNQPTWGVDAAAAATIRQAILDLAAKGAAIIVISQDLDELIEISDKFCALVGGKLSKPHQTETLDIETIGMMLGGAKFITSPEAQQ